jgi:drug/metabolite transporter (DMT)-like permease
VPSPADDRHPVAPGALLLAISGVLFALMATLAKRAAARLPGDEVATIRFLVGSGACLLAATRHRYRTYNPVGLLLRGLFGGGAVLCFFVGIEHLPVGVATLLNYTSPVFTALFAATFLREPLTAGSLSALAVTTVGVVMVVSGKGVPGSLTLGRWELLGLLGSVLSGAAVATIREVRKTEGSWEIFAAFCAIGAVLCGLSAARHWVAPTPAEWSLLVVIGLLAVGGQLLMTYALRFVQATVAGILAQIVPVGALALGWLLYGERIAGLALAGAALTLAGVTWGAWRAATPSVTEEL